MDMANKKVETVKQVKNVFTINQIKKLIALMLELLGRIIIVGVLLESIVPIDYRLGFPLENIDSGIIHTISIVPLMIWGLLPILKIKESLSLWRKGDK